MVGRIVNLAGDTVQVNINMAEPNVLEAIDRQSIEERGPSKTSMMPIGQQNPLHDEELLDAELLDLMAYLLSRGDRGNAMFAK